MLRLEIEGERIAIIPSVWKFWMRDERNVYNQVIEKSKKGRGSIVMHPLCFLISCVRLLSAPVQGFDTNWFLLSVTDSLCLDERNNFVLYANWFLHDSKAAKKNPTHYFTEGLHGSLCVRKAEYRPQKYTMAELQGCFSPVSTKGCDIGHTRRLPDGGNVQLVPDNSMMTYGVLIELAGLGEGSSRWAWSSASCLRTDEGNEWRAEWRSGCNHSREVSLQADEHQSKTQMRVMKEGERRTEKMKHERDDRTLRALVFVENTNICGC